MQSRREERSEARGEQTAQTYEIAGYLNGGSRTYRASNHSGPRCQHQQHAGKKKIERRSYMLAGRQPEIQVDRDRKLEAAREHRKNREVSQFLCLSFGVHSTRMTR